MKVCPTCHTAYEEEILRFCIKDGTPLEAGGAPDFVGLEGPVEEDDSGEITVVRTPEAPPPQPRDTEAAPEQAPRAAQAVRATVGTRVPDSRAERRPSAAYQVPPAQPNIFKVVVLTILGTLTVLGGIGLLVWSLTGAGEPATDANSNLNTAADANLDTNLDMTGFNFNMRTNVNSNANANANANVNINANANVNSNVNVNANRPNANANSDSNINANTNINRPNANRPNANVNGTVRPSPTATPVPVPEPVRTPAVNRAVNAPANIRPQNPEITRPRNVNR
jgi:hypothetical protein